MSVVLLAVAFNHQADDTASGALNIRRNAEEPVTVPEWQRGVNFSSADSFAAYSIEHSIGRPVTIRAKFARILPHLTSVQVRAVQPPLPWTLLSSTTGWTQGLLATQVNVLGELAPETVFFSDFGDSDYVSFTLRNTRLPSCGVGVHRIRWHWQFRAGIGSPWREFAVTEHTIYTVLRKPTLPWLQQPANVANTQLPWTDALDFACRWAQGARTPEEAAATITRTVYSLGNGVLSYDCAVGAAAYSFEVFLLSELIELFRGGLGRGHYINCSDCATLVATFANVVGADLWQSRMGGPFTSPFGYFPVNRLRTIGAAAWSLPCGWWPGWTFHEVAWKGGCTEEDAVFDACLQLDAYPPYGVALAPTNLRFGRIGELAYRALLAAPEGYALCSPIPFSRQRRPVA